MAGDLEAFLRGSAQARKLQAMQSGQADGGPPDIEIIEPGVGLEPVSRLAEQQRELGHAREFDSRASQLGGRVGLADEKMESHLHQVFDHQLGRLQHSDLVVVDEWTLAEQLRAMLRNPVSVRQAVVLAEILRPPTF